MHWRTLMQVRTVTCQEVARLREQDPGLELIDVRTPAEYRSVHAVGAKSIPLDELDAGCVMSQRGERADKPLYLICAGGTRSAKACQKFIAAGYSNVVSIDGGTQTWEKAGMPVEHGKKTLSLERQTRIAIGAMALLGAALAWFVHPAWVALCGFVGCGLIFAGLTNLCPLASLIAVMPWNKCGSKDGQSAKGACCKM
ncbi:MAG: rhodanese-like domain-containing protein [Phycisphaeraceae bacterium]|nr:rhodanese-like domain-containing protein [Phycisphaeraceae bacterium]